MSNTDKWDYEIEEVSSDDFELKLHLITKKGVFKNLLNKSFAKLQRNVGGISKKDFETYNMPDIVVIPEEYFPILSLPIKSLVNQVRLQCLKDKVELIKGTGKIKEAWYQKVNKEEWQINIVIRGGFKNVK